MGLRGLEGAKHVVNTEVWRPSVMATTPPAGGSLEQGVDRLEESVGLFRCFSIPTLVNFCSWCHNYKVSKAVQPIKSIYCILFMWKVI